LAEAERPAQVDPANKTSATAILLMRALYTAWP